MRMRAAVMTAPMAPLVLEELELDAPAPGEVLVDIKACGICHTDLIAGLIGPMPLIAGHEGAGVVRAVGEGVRKVKVGDRVALTFGSCGGCISCRRGAPAYCANMEALQFACQRMDGSKPVRRLGGDTVHANFFQQSSFATQALATERNVVRIPDALPFEHAAPLGCGVQTGVGAVLDTLAVPAGASIAIFGAGTVGLSAVMGAKLAGCTTIAVVDLHDNRLALALELGATHAIKASDDVLAALAAIEPDGFAYSIESAGATAAFAQSIDCLMPQGTMGLIGIPNNGQPIEFAPMQILGRGRKMIGVLEGSSVPDETIPKLARWNLEGKLLYDRLIRTYAFEDVNQAIADMHHGAAIKPVLLMG